MDNKDTLKETVWSVLSDTGIKESLARVQKLIKYAPGNEEGAKMVIDYYEKIINYD